MLSTVLFTTPQLNMIDHPLSSFSETLLPWLHACLCAHMCGIHVHIHICMCVHMHVETQGWRWVSSLINLHCVHFDGGPPLNPELSALAPVAHQLAPEIPWVGLPLTGVTGSLLHFWLVFYLALGIRAPLTFTSVWSHSLHIWRCIWPKLSFIPVSAGLIRKCIGRDSHVR